MKKKIGNILPPLIAVKSELSTQVLSEDEQAMVCEPVRVCDEQSRQGETVPSRRCAETKCRHEQIFDLTGGNSDGRNEVELCNASYGGMEKFLEKEILECSPNKRAIKNFQENGNAVKSELSATAYNIKKLPIKNLAAFTLAEILLSLTVIGIVAAIALPSLLGNANERAWETQKKALYTRFSQALPLLPSLNGYGIDDTEIARNASEIFIRDALSKIIKIRNICDTDHLADCDLPDKITTMDGEGTMNIPTKLKDIVVNAALYSEDDELIYSYTIPYVNTAAFETANGESILVFYNPKCESDLNEIDRYFAPYKFCTNFIYDLNGKKGPNTIGKDMGFITAFYATNSVVVAPNVIPKNLAPPKQIGTNSWLAQPVGFNLANSKCKEADSNSRIPNKEEGMSIVINRKLISPDRKFIASPGIWVSTFESGEQSTIIQNDGVIEHENEGSVLCIKR